MKDDASFVAGVVASPEGKPDKGAVQRLVVAACDGANSRQVYRAAVVIFEHIYCREDNRSQYQVEFFGDLREAIDEVVPPMQVSLRIPMVRAAAEKLIGLLVPEGRKSYIRQYLIDASWVYDLLALDENSRGAANKLARICAEQEKNELAAAFKHHPEISQGFKRAVGAFYYAPYADKLWDIDEGRLDILKTREERDRDLEEMDRACEIEELHIELGTIDQFAPALFTPEGSELATLARRKVKRLFDLDPENALKWLDAEIKSPVWRGELSV